MKARSTILRCTVAASLLLAAPLPAFRAAAPIAPGGTPLVIIDQDVTSMIGGNADVITIFLHAPASGSPASRR